MSNPPLPTQISDYPIPNKPLFLPPLVFIHTATDAKDTVAIESFIMKNTLYTLPDSFLTPCREAVNALFSPTTPPDPDAHISIINGTYTSATTTLVSTLRKLYGPDILGRIAIFTEAIDFELAETFLFTDVEYIDLAKIESTYGYEQMLLLQEVHAEEETRPYTYHWSTLPELFTYLTDTYAPPSSTHYAEGAAI